MNAPETLDLQNKQIESAYDSKPYTSKAFSYSAPGHMRAVAHLYGVDSVSLAQARVLELGCASGGNLLPFALAYPQSTVVGIDLSSVQIAHGQQILDDLNVTNMRLHALDLHQITAEFGEFDYIIVHGVFSWVPLEVKQAILRICRENLSPQGIAYVSYNTYPGWKAGDVIRDAMLLHSHGIQGDGERLASARAMLALMTEGLADSNSMGPSIRALVSSLKTHSDYYIIHEYLEQFNTPCYFVEFADLATQSGLAYLGDAEPQTELAGAYGQNVQLHLSIVALGQPKVMRQQYLDFAIGRTFRKTLLVQDKHAHSIAMQPNLDRLRDLRFAGYFEALEPDANPGVRYRNAQGRELRTTDPVMQSILASLILAWPRSVSFQTLCEGAVGQTSDPAKVSDAVQSELSSLFQHSLLHYTLEPSPYDRPKGSEASLLPAFAYLHRHNQDPAFTTGCFNFWHNAIVMETNSAQTWLLAQLEKTLDSRQATSVLARALQRGIVPGPDGEDLTGRRNLEPAAQTMVNRLFVALRQCGLLIGEPATGE